MPPIRVLPGGTLAAGPWEIRPSRRDWRRRRSWWTAWRDGRPVTRAYLTPRLALLAAMRAEKPPNILYEYQIR